MDWDVLGGKGTKLRPQLFSMVMGFICRLLGKEETRTGG